MTSIFLGNRHFTYKVLRKPISSLRLRLLSPSSFQVSAPSLTPEFLVTRFIKSNSDWITRQAPKIIPQTKLSTLKSINILGENYRIIQRISTQNSLIVFQEEKEIHLNSTSLAQTHLKKLYDQKLRPLALSLIKEELSVLAKQHGFKYHRVSIRNQSSRFGSCSTAGNLNFNWQIILFPKEQFRHVLLHELTHLLHHNHSRSFWHQLAVFDPNWKSNNLWLKKEGTRCLIVS